MRSPYLEIDINCTKCGRLMAYTNGFRWHNEYLCPNCSPSLEEMVKEIKKGGVR